MGSRASASPSMDDYQAESDHSTLARSAEITQSPKRMAGVAKHHQKVTKQLKRTGSAIKSMSSRSR